MTRNLLAPLSLAMALAFGAVDPARAGVLFNTFGPGDSYSTSLGYSVAGTNTPVPAELGFAFTPTATGALDRIEVAFLRNFIVDPFFELRLYSDNGSGQLGALIERFPTVGPATPFGSIATIGSSSNPVLASGETYWLVAAPQTINTWVVWLQNTIGAKATEYISRNGSVTYNSNLTAPAFRLTSIAVAAPEPGSLALAASGTLGLGLIARVRRRR